MLNGLANYDWGFGGGLVLILAYLIVLFGIITYVKTKKKHDDEWI